MAIGSNVETVFWSTKGERPYANEPYLVWLTNVTALPDNKLPNTISVSYGDNEWQVCCVCVCLKCEASRQCYPCVFVETSFCLCASIAVVLRRPMLTAHIITFPRGFPCPRLSSRTLRRWTSNFRNSVSAARPSSLPAATVEFPVVRLVPASQATALCPPGLLVST